MQAWSPMTEHPKLHLYPDLQYLKLSESRMMIEHICPELLGGICEYILYEGLMCPAIDEQ